MKLSFGLGIASVLEEAGGFCSLLGSPLSALFCYHGTEQLEQRTTLVGFYDELSYWTLKILIVLRIKIELDVRLVETTFHHLLHDEHFLLEGGSILHECAALNHQLNSRHLCHCMPLGNGSGPKTAPRRISLMLRALAASGRVDRPPSHHTLPASHLPVRH